MCIILRGESNKDYNFDYPLSISQLKFYPATFSIYSLQVKIIHCTFLSQLSQSLYALLIEIHFAHIHYQYIYYFAPFLVSSWFIKVGALPASLLGHRAAGLSLVHRAGRTSHFWIIYFIKRKRFWCFNMQLISSNTYRTFSSFGLSADPGVRFPLAYNGWYSINKH